MGFTTFLVTPWCACECVREATPVHSVLDSFFSSILKATCKKLDLLLATIGFCHSPRCVCGEGSHPRSQGTGLELFSGFGLKLLLLLLLLRWVAVARQLHLDEH